MVTTGTASGKTLAFNLPVLDAVARDPKLRTLYLYPTKALAQDQFRGLSALRLPGLKPAIYDGDTPTEQRWQIRKWSNAILTNPDMVHIGLLPNHERWGEVLANLRYVVVDEAHVYRGVFGSHVANVLRRLRRLARVYGAEPIENAKAVWRIVSGKKEASGEWEMRTIPIGKNISLGRISVDLSQFVSPAECTLIVTVAEPVAPPASVALAVMRCIPSES
jgi:Lhr-like helicase